MPVTLRPSIWDTDRWICNTVAELESALREYRDAEEPADGNGTEEDERDGELDRRFRIYAQNKVIDQAMRFIRPTHRPEWHLLKGFYLWELWKDQSRGWHDAAEMMGWEMPVCIKSERCRTAADPRMELPLCENGHDCPALLDKFWRLHSGALDALLRAVKRRQ